MEGFGNDFLGPLLGRQVEALIMALRHPLKAFRGIDTTSQACQAKSYGRPLAGVFEAGQTLIMEPDGLSTTACLYPQVRSRSWAVNADIEPSASNGDQGTMILAGKAHGYS